eukprot:TRINITY_DN1331_c0_g2_i1.p1 TRINITY_DN1331_c0_g2~~TRINITY_DN1331_c0_g2_i1.p1  ORF type:complete len:107 (+),score=17.02 TRINITY_DN1331_c0_g2_i1:172-492(+)
MALGKDYHKLCLKCSACAKKLEPGSFSDRDNQLFCKGCYAKTKGGATGYGFWSGTSGVSGVYGEEDKREPIGKPPAVGADTKPCSGCGSAIPSVAKFCSACGSKQD